MTEDGHLAAARAEARKGRTCLSAAEQLVGLGLHDDAMSRLYYAIFHMAAAALLLLGVEPTSHQALQQLFSRDLVRPGHFTREHARILAGLMGLRHQADYNRDFETDREGAVAELARARPLIDALEAFLGGRGAGAQAR